MVVRFSKVIVLALPISLEGCEFAWRFSNVFPDVSGNPSNIVDGHYLDDGALTHEPHVIAEPLTVDPFSPRQDMNVRPAEACGFEDSEERKVSPPSTGDLAASERAPRVHQLTRRVRWCFPFDAP
jgi:hypothetical protein